jgi:hypothetical protein
MQILDFLLARFASASAQLIDQNLHSRRVLLQIRGNRIFFQYRFDAALQIRIRFGNGKHRFLLLFILAIIKNHLKYLFTTLQHLQTILNACHIPLQIGIVLKRSGLAFLSVIFFQIRRQARQALAHLIDLHHFVRFLCMIIRKYTSHFKPLKAIKITPTGKAFVIQAPEFGSKKTKAMQTRTRLSQVNTLEIEHITVKDLTNGNIAFKILQRFGKLFGRAFSRNLLKAILKQIAQINAISKIAVHSQLTLVQIMDSVPIDVFKALSLKGGRIHPFS